MKKYLKSLVLIVLVFILVSAAVMPSLAENSSEPTTTAMRMQPLVDKYNSLSQEQLSAELAKYTDSTNHWGKNYISKISALEIISGYGNGKFGPNDKLLAGQYILMLIRTIGFRPEVPQGTPYYRPFVDVALQEGILKTGEISDYMKPITRELAASLARRVVGLYEEVPADYFVHGDDPEAIGDKGFFDNVYVGYQKTKMTDFPSITSKYLQDVIDCYRMGLITGSDNKFNPKGSLTRAEASVIITKLLDKSLRVESVPGENEKFKHKNTLTGGHLNRTEEYRRFENKEYTIYRGVFPLIEIWDTAYAMDKNKSIMNDGAYCETYNEKDQLFAVEWFINAEIEETFRMDNPYGLILSQNTVYINTEKTKIKKGEQYSIYDNSGGSLYDVNSWDVDNYNKSFKPYVYELMKVWFGEEYEKAKKLHDQYLGYAINDKDGEWNFYLINGRQVQFAGGRDLGGVGFHMQVWAKGTITEDTMFKIE